MRNAGQKPDLSLVQKHLPSAFAIDESVDDAGLWSVRSARVTNDIGETDPGETIAKLGKTLPVAADVVGYRGPTQSLIVFDKELSIQKVVLIDSQDTREHVEAVQGDKEFFGQFQGWPWGGPDDAVVDAVSGATLTSLALAEGILKRIGGERPSLVFADPITDAEEEQWLAGEHSDDTLIRTGPLSDDVAGYQGPTELLMRVHNGKVDRIELRYSYDNEPYVDYVRTEYGFWPIFQGKTVAELAAYDPKAAGVEGVSGATMTSLAVADTIVAAAKQIESIESESEMRQEETGQPFWTGLRWSIADTGTIMFLLMLGIASQLKLFRRKWARIAWLVCALAVIGIWSGNLMSIALIAGWSAEGVAWRLAPGLAAVVGIAVLAPPLTKSNPYCNHICPHGAIQQLVRPTSRSRRRWKIPSRIQKGLAWIPGITLTAAYCVLIIWPAVDLSSWEPFHAYLFRIAGWGAFVLAGASLVFAYFVPMGYCRMGCPTGRLLDYLRRTRTSYRLQRSDMVAACLLAFAIWMRSR